RPGMGRVLQATKDLSPGELILVEEPLISWVNGKIAECVSKIQKMSTQQRQQLMDMYHLKYGEKARFDSCEARMEEYRALARMVPQACLIPDDAPDEHQDAGPPWAATYEALNVMKLNTHCISSLPWEMQEVDDVQRMLPQGAPRVTRVALFPLASKAAHSCVPNCVWTTQNPYGHISYFAARPIAAGDAITMSYVAPASAAPTLERWANTAFSKDFICTCPQCSGPDATRAVKCAHCADGVAMP
ncbi:hypothetical protein JKP88DRAFT_142912, partial [Tribonema minus]